MQGPLPPRKLFIVFSSLMLGMFLAALDQTIVATALPTIVRDLGGLEHLSWVVTSYLLTTTASTPLWGKLGDLYGRKRVFQAAILIFLVGSALCGASRSMFQLILFRGIQGVGGGGLIVTAQAIIGDIVSPRDRGRYQGIFGAVFGVTSVIGPLVGGFFVDYFSWHWVFLINLPIGLVALAVTAVTLPSGLTHREHVIDYAGATLVALATMAFVLMLTLGGERYEWTSWPMLALAATGTVLAALFIRVERGAAEPVLPPRLFRISIVRIASGIAFTVGIALLGPATFIPLFLQVATGASPTDSGLLMLPLMLSVPATSIVSGQIVSRTGRYRFLPIGGMALVSAGLLLMSRLDANTSAIGMAVPMICLGVGIGMTMQVLIIAVQNAVDYSDLGAATSAVTFARSMGGVFGVALFGGIFADRLAHYLAQDLSGPQAYASATNAVMLAGAPFAAIAFLLAWRLRELPLRETVRGEHVPAVSLPADLSSDDEIRVMLSRFANRESRHDLYARLIEAAGVNLAPIDAWLLFRIEELEPATIPRLAQHLPLDEVAVADQVRGLMRRGLLATTSHPEATLHFTPEGQAALEKLVAARADRLRALIRDWNPERHAALEKVVRQLARTLVPMPLNS